MIDRANHPLLLHNPFRVLLLTIGVGTIAWGLPPSSASPCLSQSHHHKRSDNRKNVRQERQNYRTRAEDPWLNDRRVAVLNRLRNDIVSTYGYLDGSPRVNLGPCGRFARDFRELWNSRFQDNVNIVFVMKPDGSDCHHVMVKLPDGNLYDGGNGVITATAMKLLIPNCRLDEMTDFDPKRLDKWSYGLGRNYPNCPDYSDKVTRNLITVHLAELPMTTAGQPSSPQIQKQNSRSLQ